jgi:hypothetical protein
MVCKGGRVICWGAGGGGGDETRSTRTNKQTHKHTNTQNTQTNKRINKQTNPQTHKRGTLRTIRKDVGRVGKDGGVCHTTRDGGAHRASQEHGAHGLHHLLCVCVFVQENMHTRVCLQQHARAVGGGGVRQRTAHANSALPSWRRACRPDNNAPRRCRWRPSGSVCASPRWWRRHWRRLCGGTRSGPGGSSQRGGACVCDRGN